MDAINSNPSLSIQRLPSMPFLGASSGAPREGGNQAGAPEDVTPAQLAIIAQQAKQDVEAPKNDGRQLIKPEVLKGSLEYALQQLNDMFFQTGLQFILDSDTHSMVVQVIDKATKEVIRAIPPEDVLALKKRLAGIGDLRGVLLDHEG